MVHFEFMEQDAANDGKAGLKSSFQHLNTKIKQNVDVRQMDGQTAGQTDNINP